MKKYFIAGLLVWMPLIITFVVLRTVITILDKTLLLLPESYRPHTWLAIDVPGLGVLLAVTIVLITGMIVANFFGRRLVSRWEALLARIPLVRTLYAGTKQIMETILAADSKSFRKVLLIQYPRKGVWSLAFMTSDSLGEVQDKAPARVISVFVPTTPNPTSGFVLMVPEEDTIELDMSIEDGLKMIISMGVIVPPTKKEALLSEQQSKD